MAFFDKIGDKAKGLVDSAKITYKVSEEKSKLSELYEHLGLLVWEAHQNDAEPPAELVPVFDRIREIHASSKSLRQSFRALSPKSTLTAAATATENAAAARMIPPPRIRSTIEAVMPQMSMDAAAKIFMPLTAQLSARAAAGRLTSFPLSARAAETGFPPMTPQNPIVRQSVIALHAVPS